MVTLEHIYKFTAIYEDGTVIEQNDTDTSEIEEGKSRFYDVLKKGEDTKLLSFVIHNDDIQVGVDLVDGHFEMNGVPFFQHRPDLEPYNDFRVIYYRTVRHVLSQEGQILESYILGYAVGWQTTHEGKNVQRIVMV